MLKRKLQLNGICLSNKLFKYIAFLIVLTSGLNHNRAFASHKHGNIGKNSISNGFYVSFLIYCYLTCLGCLYVRDLCHRGIEYCFDGNKNTSANS